MEVVVEQEEEEKEEEEESPEGCCRWRDCLRTPLRHGRSGSSRSRAETDDGGRSSVCGGETDHRRRTTCWWATRGLCVDTGARSINMNIIVMTEKRQRLMDN
jgi:hypothetical protein